MPLGRDRKIRFLQRLLCEGSDFQFSAFTFQLFRNLEKQRCVGWAGWLAGWLAGLGWLGWLGWPELAELAGLAGLSWADWELNKFQKAL